MKKDRVRDYATEAFRDYARALKSPKDMPEAQRLNHAAVKNMLEYFADKKPYIVSAVKAVYFAAADFPLRKNTVSFRVREYALSVPVDERSVYRDLKSARDKFAEYRGLAYIGRQ